MILNYPKLDENYVNQLLAIECMGYIPVRGEWWIDEDSSLFNCPTDQAEAWAVLLDKEPTFPFGIKYGQQTYTEIPLSDWCPAVDIQDAYQVQQKLLSEPNQYISALIQVHHPTCILEDEIKWNEPLVKLLLTSTAAQMCEAALYTLKENRYD